MPQRQCEFVKANGERCRGFALPNKAMCWFHEPSIAKERTEARRSGGKTRSKGAATLPADADDLPLKTTEDVKAALAVTINQVRRGELDAKIANALGYLMAALLRALEPGEQAKELAELKAQWEAFKRSNHAQPATGTGRTQEGHGEGSPSPD